MKKRIVKCISIFSLLIIFIVCAGILFPEKTAISTDSDNIISERILVPCGNSVGVQMDVKGVLVVGTTKECNAQIGDMITAVNNIEVSSPEEVNSIVADSEQTVKISAVRNGSMTEYAVTPYFDQATGEYKLGLWIKDRIAGIGTLTFYDPKTSRFVALGHGIYEPETGVLLNVEDGKLLKTQVDSIKNGKTGSPGELGGTVYNFDKPVGELKNNTEFGIICDAEPMTDLKEAEPMVMAYPKDVKKGPAYIKTTVNGTRTESFDIEITKVKNQNKAKIKGIEFRVTDKKLIDKSGGIVQGMSGSPIIQNGRLVGAVTHVFVNDPTRGYGIYAKWMVEECDSL